MEDEARIATVLAVYETTEQMGHACAVLERVGELKVDPTDRHR